jgi:hypothetical protein
MTVSGYHVLIEGMTEVVLVSVRVITPVSSWVRVIPGTIAVVYAFFSALT